MSDLVDKIYEILKKPQLSGLATITEDGKPWVRYVLALTSEDLTIHIATFAKSRKVSQIEKNPEVHLTCGITDPANMGPYLQIQGRATLDTSKEMRHSLWYDELNNIFQGPDDPHYGVIQVIPYRIEYCTLETPEPVVWTSK